MTKRMLIDSTHPEETRVVVIDGTRLDDFDFESATKKQLKGNIYLARVTRVEPSLQAAFVEYGGGRHGFLAFSEIHPDYYRIPIADREALLAAEAEQARWQEQNEAEEERGGRHRRRGRHHRNSERGHGAPEGDAEHAAPVDHSMEDQPIEDRPMESGEPGSMAQAEPAPDPVEPGRPAPDASAGDQPVATERHADDGAQPWDYNRQPDAPPSTKATEMAPADRLSTDAVPDDDGLRSMDTAAEAADAASDAQPRDEAGTEQSPPGNGEAAVPSEDQVEVIGGDDYEEASRRRARSFRRYKIQEVIKRRQVMLIQVVKEERGNKGAALTTYLSLAGRYCVLMPNTARGGGISRKITSAGDRKRLKSMLDDLEIPDGMAVIVRTAGSERSKPEVKRDYEYLVRLWDSIREQTLQSSAPALIHEEANLIKRSIRDLYARDIDEVLVDGEDGYRVAKDFMRMLMPSHSKRVQPYRDPVPLFQRFQIEGQIDAIHQPTCQLRSGGYIVINQTEALVAIDVNSGRATRERHIEETAVKTNLEAADEIARQLRLRDLAGLVVIDFIDMEDNRNNHAVERRFKEAMRFDRARIQIGRISPFGLLELSRQRLRPSLVEASTDVCPHCAGTGRIRSADSAGLHVLRAIEDEALRGKASEVAVHVGTSVALYILNQKRPALNDIEQRYAIRVLVERDDTLIPPAFRIERLRQRAPGEQLPRIETRRGMANIDPEAEAAADAAAEAAARALDRESEAADAEPHELREPVAGTSDLIEASDDVAAEAPRAPRPRDERRTEGGGRKRRRRHSGKFDSDRGEERPAGAAEAIVSGGRGERPAPGSEGRGGEHRRRPEFQRRALPTPAEFEVGGAGMFGRPNLDDPAAAEPGEPFEAGEGEAQPDGERPFTSRPDDDQDASRKRRRRGRRGGRRRRRDQPEGTPQQAEGTPHVESSRDEPRFAAAYEPEMPVPSIVPPAALDMKQPSISTWPRPWPARDAQPPAMDVQRPIERSAVEPQPAEPQPVRAVVPEPAPQAAPPPVAAPQPEPKPEPVLKGDLLGESTAPRRSGWWRRG